MNKPNISLFDSLKQQIWNETTKLLDAKPTSCMFCGGNHDGSFCMAMPDDFCGSQDMSDEGIDKY